jgi:uncharacterized membrane protein required for colicin V production
MDTGNLPFNWFDLVLVAVLVAGILRGRKRGMSEELLPVLQWIGIMLCAALGYQPLGDWLGATWQIFSPLFSYIVAYLLIGVGVNLVFLVIKRGLHGKLIGSNVFGRGEYYLGMPAGMVRFTCILMCALALLNARLYSQAELRATEAYTQEYYGSDFFPGMHALQVNVFEKSFMGRQIREYLGFLLIKPTVAKAAKELKQKEWKGPY